MPLRELAAQGWWAETIARHLQIQPRTVRKYMELDHLVDRRHGSRRALAEPYRAYLEHRWAEGCTDRRQLWRELEARGYTGSYRERVEDHPLLGRASRLPAPFTAPSSATTPPAVIPSPRNLAAPARARGPESLRHNVSGSPVSGQSRHRASRHNLRGALSRWCMSDRSLCSIPGWSRPPGVASANCAALPWVCGRTTRRCAPRWREPWSQGPTEGHILRLKLLKRQMYGRAKVDLLRQRVLQRG